jgi:hypothetical protein
MNKTIDKNKQAPKKLSVTEIARKVRKRKALKKAYGKSEV